MNHDLSKTGKLLLSHKARVLWVIWHIAKRYTIMLCALSGVVVVGIVIICVCTPLLVKGLNIKTPYLNKYIHMKYLVILTYIF